MAQVAPPRPITIPQATNINQEYYLDSGSSKRVHWAEISTVHTFEYVEDEDREIIIVLKKPSIKTRIHNSVHSIQRLIKML